MTDTELPYLLYTVNIVNTWAKNMNGYNIHISNDIWKINSSIQLLMKYMGKYSFLCLHSFITHLTCLITLEKIKKGMYPKVIFKLVLKS